MSEHQNKDEGRRVKADSDTLVSPAVKRNGAEDLREIGERAKVACKSYEDDVKAIQSYADNFTDKSLERFERAKELLRLTIFDRNGRMDLLKKYCLDDVKVTKQVYEYALKNQKVLYRDFFNIREIPLAISEPSPRVGVLKQEVLF
jgi:glycosylphosphatidylinositol transamidase (GPIT) subunit GPI8